MSSHQSTQASQEEKHEESASYLSRTLHAKVELSDTRMKYREFAHKKFIPAIKRANDDDDKQESFTTTAEDLGKAGWILTELALRVADLAERRG